MKTWDCAETLRPATAMKMSEDGRDLWAQKRVKYSRYRQTGSTKAHNNIRDSHTLTAWEILSDRFVVQILVDLLAPVATRLPIEIVYSSYFRLQI